MGREKRGKNDGGGRREKAKSFSFTVERHYVIKIEQSGNGSMDRGWGL